MNEARKKYRQKVKRIYLDFYPTEADLFEYVETQPKKQTYIKKLIRKDMVPSDDPFIEALAALRALGVSCANIGLHQIFGDQIGVEIDGEYFGLWDVSRKTFVD